MYVFVWACVCNMFVCVCIILWYVSMCVLYNLWRLNCRASFAICSTGTATVTTCSFTHLGVHLVTFSRTIITIFPTINNTRRNAMLLRPLLYSEWYDLAWPSAVPVNDNAPVEYSVSCCETKHRFLCCKAWPRAVLYRSETSIRVCGEFCAKLVLSSQTRNMFCWLHLAFLWIIKEILGGESCLLHL